MSKYIHIARGKNAMTSRWSSRDSRWDDPCRVFCLAAGAGDTVSLKWALEESSLLVHGHPVRRYNTKVSNDAYPSDWPDPFAFGWTAMHCACSSGRKEVVRYLLDHNWHLNRRTWDGFVASDVVGMNGYTQQGYMEAAKRVRKSGVLNADEQALYLFITSWENTWNDLVSTSENLFVLQSVRRRITRHTIRTCDKGEPVHEPINSLWGVDQYWIESMEIILKYLLGIHVFETLGARGKTLWNFVKRSMLRWGNKNMVPERELGLEQHEIPSPSSLQTTTPKDPQTVHIPDAPMVTGPQGKKKYEQNDMRSCHKTQTLSLSSTRSGSRRPRPVPSLYAHSANRGAEHFQPVPDKNIP